jgi:C-terminal processing protease CtpA/Prc
VVAFLRASFPIASSESLFSGDRIATVNGCPVNSGPEAAKLIKSSASNQILLGIDTRQTETETRIIDKGSHSRYGLTMCHADPNHPLNSVKPGQVAIATVEGDSPADHAGLKAGDVVLSVEGVPATNVLFTREMLNQTGRRIALTIRPPSGVELLWMQKMRKGKDMLGFTLKIAQHMCVVHKVSSAHAALFCAEQGLRVNDVLIAINNSLVRRKDQAIDILCTLEGIVELRVMRAFLVVPMA